MNIRKFNGLSSSNSILNIPCNIIKNMVEISDTVSLNGKVITSWSDSKKLFFYDEINLELIRINDNINQIVHVDKNKMSLIKDDTFSSYDGSQIDIFKSTEKFSSDDVLLYIINDCKGENFYALMIENWRNKDRKSEKKRYVVKINKKTFHVKWKILVENYSSCQCISNNSNIFFFDANDDIFCASSEDGSILWKKKFDELALKNVGNMYNFWPGLYNNNIVVICQYCTVGFDANTGNINWIFDKAWGYGLISDEGRVYQIGYNGSKLALYIVCAETGQVLSDHILTMDDAVFLEKLFHVNPLSWTISKTHIWVGWVDGYLIAINKETSHIDWYTQLEGTVSEGMLIANNRLYCHTRTPNIHTPNNSYVIEGEGGYILDESR